jgi:hypothetical protein
MNEHDDIHNKSKRFMKYMPVMEQLMDFIPQVDPPFYLCLLFQQMEQFFNILSRQMVSPS